MKRLLIIVALLTISFIAGGIISCIPSFVVGAKYGRQQMQKNEIELMIANLRFSDAIIQNELREHLKKRYYYLSTYVSDKWLKDNAYDFGVPNTNYCRLSAGREGDYWDDDYCSFTQRMYSVMKKDNVIR